MTRIGNQIGTARLERKMGSLVNELLKGVLTIGKTAVKDATFIEVCSERDPLENGHGGSDPESK